MAKSLFQSAKAEIKKKRVFMLSIDLINKLQEIEAKAEKYGISFPLNKHVEEAVTKLINAAEKELERIEAKQDLSGLTRYLPGSKGADSQEGFD